MNRLVPKKDRDYFLEDLQAHGRCIAKELKSASVSYDTLVHEAEDSNHFEGWEMPAGKLPTYSPLMLGIDGIYVSYGDRLIGREVRPLSEKEVALYGAARAIRQNLFALEAKHAIFDKIRNGINKERKP